MKAAAKGNVEIRSRTGAVFARFNTFGQAAKACAAAHYADVVLFECTTGSSIARRQVWEPVADFSTEQ